jgi:hypothetical protein
MTVKKSGSQEIGVRFQFPRRLTDASSCLPLLDQPRAVYVATDLLYIVLGKLGEAIVKPVVRSCVAVNSHK